MDSLIGLPAEITTALTIIVTGVLIPVVTSLLNNPNLPSKYKRLIPIGLAALAAVIIVLLQAGGPFAEQVMTWIVVLATLVGIAQGLYALMPGAWKNLETSTSKGKRARRDEGTAS